MKTVLKWIAIAFGQLVLVAAVGAAAAYGVSNRHINKTYAPTVVAVALASDSATIERGRHIGIAITKCVDCHGDDLGGSMLIDDGAFARVAAPNITSGNGSRTASYTPEDWARTIRHGVKPDGHSVLVMPAEAYTYLSDADLAAVVAWVRSMPAVDRTWPAPAYGPVSRALIAAGKLPVFTANLVEQTRANVPPAPPADTTAAYGDYLTKIGGCRACHGMSMSGSHESVGEPGSPPPANLTPTGIGGWEEADFVRLLRTGKRWHSEQQVSDAMPWRNSGKMTDAEIHAVWLYLRTLPAKETGQP